jgi:prepilin-type N-terminal cleavage/methylation domain-containing protein
MMHPDYRKQERGFTLIEVLVAFMVAALLMMIILPAALDATSREDKAQRLRNATAMAVTLIGERKALPPVLEERDGEEGRLTWRTSETVIRADPRGLLALTRIEAIILDDRGHVIFHASTHRLAPAVST